jgi:hypothetical protein
MGYIFHGQLYSSTHHRQGVRLKDNQDVSEFSESSFELYEEACWGCISSIEEDIEYWI